MERRACLRMMAAGAIAAGLPRFRAAAPKRPNIVLILADDMGFSDLGCYGSEISTPNLDQLAQRGVRFTQFYNNARCCPSRTSILTGLYAHQAGVGGMTGGDGGVPGYRGDLNPQCVTIAQVLRGAGYRTAMVGKWHVTYDFPKYYEDRHNWPLQRGFERYFGTIAGAGSYYDPYFLVRDNEHVQADRRSFYYTDAIADNAAAFLGEYAGKGKPFFLYAAFTAPHWPLHALADDIEKYKNRYLKGWDALREERHRRMIEMSVVDGKWPLSPRDPRVPAWKDAPDRKWQARRMAVYAAQVDHLDRGVGKILAKLKETGVERDTLVLFLSDNGGCAEELTPQWKLAYIPSKTRDGRPVRLGNNPSVMPGPEDTYQSCGLPWANASNTPLRLYKHYCHEGGISTPLIAAGAGLIEKPGSITNQLGHIIDLMATCVDVAGTRYPSVYDGNNILPLEGTSLLPVFQGRWRQPHDAIYWEHEGNRAIRQGKGKLVMQHQKNEAWELYDVEADRTELHNLAPTMPEKAKEMAAMWQTWAERCHVFPKPKGFK
jgi:arylsulfatase A-like enzyme